MTFKQIANFLNSPVMSALSKGLIIIGTVLSPVVLFAAVRWFDERVAQVPALVAVVGKADSSEKSLGEVATAARELTREVAALKASDAAQATEIKAASLSAAAVERQLVILQTQLSVQRSEDTRRFDEMQRKLEKIGDRLGVP